MALDGLFYRQQKFLRLHGFTLLLLAIAAYFVYHGISGSRGYVSWLELKETVAVAESRLDKLVTERQALDRLITDLEPHQIDADLLDELLRQQGFIRENEVILLDE